MSKPSPNRNSPAAVLLPEGWRQGHKTVKRTLATLTHWPAHKIEALRPLLRDETLVSPQEGALHHHPKLYYADLRH